MRSVVHFNHYMKFHEGKDYIPRFLDDREIDRICADPTTHQGSLITEETYTHPKFTTAEEQE